MGNIPQGTKFHGVAVNKNAIRFILAMFWSVAAVIYIYGVTFFIIPEDNHRAVDTVLGFVLGTIVATVMGFYFGSSQGSSDKTDIMKTKE
jgi:uncharacterized membrane protein YgaE (UPF0421/DUF939 family)